MAYTVMNPRGGVLRASDYISQIARTCICVMLYVLYIHNFSHSKSENST